MNDALALEIGQIDVVGIFPAIFVFIVIHTESLVDSQLLEAFAQFFSSRIYPFVGHCSIIMEGFSFAWAHCESARVLTLLFVLVEGNPSLNIFLPLLDDRLLAHEFRTLEGQTGLRCLEGGKIREEVGFLSEVLGGDLAQILDAFGGEVVGGVLELGDDACVGVLESCEEVALGVDSALSALLHGDC